jgi:SAM-dependent methyltransferase
VPTGPRTHTNRTRAESFGSDALAYDLVRPGYPPELIDDLVADGPRSALDVGCGTGKAARLLEARGVRVLGLEIDLRMAEVARGHGIPVVVSAFETWEADGRSFDLIVSGQAWHWIDPVRGARKAGALLRPDGLLGLFWNFAQLDPAARRVVNAAYDAVAPELNETSVLRGNGPATLPGHIETLRRTRGFGRVERRQYSWQKVYRRDEWLALIRTHSDHSTLPPDRLRALLVAVSAAFDAIGGSATAKYTTDAVFARRQGVAV